MKKQLINEGHYNHFIAEGHNRHSENNKQLLDKYIKLFKHIHGCPKNSHINFNREPPTDI